MEMTLEDFKTGWFGLQVGLTDAEIDKLLQHLSDLKKTKGHFHIRSDMEGSGGVGDVEFFWAKPSNKSGYSIE